MRSLMRCMLSLVTASFATAGGSACGEIPDMKLERMEEVCSHIFTGKLVRIYSHVDRSRPGREITHCVAEIELARVGKGEHAAPIAYVRFFTERQTSGEPQPGSSGHRGIPKEGETTRVFVTVGQDGGYDVLPPNGFTKVAK